MQTIRDKLIAVLAASNVELDAESTEDTPLIQSGKLDSLALFNLALFVESEIGHEVDVTSFDLAMEWNTISNILTFITRMRGSH